MKSALLMSALVTVAMARPSVVQLSPLSNLQSSASASASASSIPQQLSLVRLVPHAPLLQRDRVLDSLEVSLNRAEAQRRGQVLGPLVSATSSASAASSVLPTVDSLDARLAGVSQRQVLQTGLNPLLTSTRLTQTLANASPTGASSSSSAQLLESPDLSLVRAQQRVLNQQLVGPLIQSNGLPLVVDSSGQLIAGSSLLVL